MNFMNGGGVKKDQTILMSFMDGPYVAYHKLKTAWAPSSWLCLLKFRLLFYYLCIYKFFESNFLIHSAWENLSCDPIISN